MIGSTNEEIAHIIAKASGREVFALVITGKELSSLPEGTELTFTELVALRAYGVFKLVVEGVFDVDTKH
jgi:hypothetical protein